MMTLEPLVYFIIAVLVAEFFFGFGVSWLINRRSHYAIKTRSMYKFHPRCGYALRPNMVYSNPQGPFPNMPRKIANFDIRTDEHGFCCEPMSIRNHNGVFGVCMGGSTTMGAESAFSETYPEQLNGLMPQSVKIFNAGVGGYRSIHELLSFREKVKSLRPRAIVLYSGFNDFERFFAGFTPEEINDPFSNCFTPSLPATSVENFLEYSALMNFCLRGVKRIFGPRVDRQSIALHNEGKRDWVEPFFENVRLIHKECKEMGCVLFMLTHPTPCVEGAPPEAVNRAAEELGIPKQHYELYASNAAMLNSMIKRFCEREGIAVVDIASHFEKLSEDENGVTDYELRYGFFVDRVHYTAKANGIIAECVAASLQGIWQEA